MIKEIIGVTILPELPEVETVVQGLKDLTEGRKIMTVKVREEKIIGYPEKVNEFIHDVINKKIVNLGRRGKYILINLDQYKTMVVHLRMTGKLLVKASELPFEKHTHVIFELDNDQDLRFNNVRKFGRIYLVDSGNWEKAGGLNELGPEPLADDFTLECFEKQFENRRASIKSLLLDQSFIAGLGNIYTDEVLFMAGINPGRKANTLSREEIKKIYKSIRKLLKLGIKYGGTTFSDYVNVLGKKGSFQRKLLVYQQQGKKCPECGAAIVKEKIAGRSTHYCPQCQK